ncbi:hypothetical protein CBL_12584 [Carabus blaptoides fortunei]
MKITIVLLVVAAVTVTESRPFFLFPLRPIVCDIMCQPPYSDSFCSFCNRSPQQQQQPQGVNSAQTSASATGNGNANVNAQSSASVRGAAVPGRTVTTSTPKAPVSAGLNGVSPTSTAPPTTTSATTAATTAPPAAPAQ